MLRNKVHHRFIKIDFDQTSREKKKPNRTLISGEQLFVLSCHPQSILGLCPLDYGQLCGERRRLKGLTKLFSISPPFFCTLTPSVYRYFSHAFYPTFLNFLSLENYSPIHSLSHHNFNLPYFSFSVSLFFGQSTLILGFKNSFVLLLPSSVYLFPCLEFSHTTSCLQILLSLFFSLALNCVSTRLLRYLFWSLEDFSADTFNDSVDFSDGSSRNKRKRKKDSFWALWEFGFCSHALLECNECPGVARLFCWTQKRK